MDWDVRVVVGETAAEKRGERLAPRDEEKSQDGRAGMVNKRLRDSDAGKRFCCEGPAARGQTVENEWIKMVQGR
jgi:hypothetical protein